jgi:hypothetical protein
VTVELAFSYTVPSTDDRRGVARPGVARVAATFAETVGFGTSPLPAGVLRRQRAQPGRDRSPRTPSRRGLARPLVPHLDGARCHRRAEPDGFGYIANFPAAIFSATIDVPDDWEVFTGGKTVDRREECGRATYHEEGIGLRDLSIYAGRDVETTVVDVDGVTVRPSVRPTTPRCSLR